MIAKVKRFVRQWWWLFLLGAGVVLYVAWKVFGPREPVNGPPKPPPKFIDMARTEVEKVHLEGEVEKAKIRTRAEGQREQIAAIEEKGKKDPAAARRELAAFLASNL
jgi:hypothetical protein